MSLAHGERQGSLLACSLLQHSSVSSFVGVRVNRSWFWCCTSRVIMCMCDFLVTVLVVATFIDGVGIGAGWEMLPCFGAIYIYCDTEFCVLSLS